MSDTIRNINLIIADRPYKLKIKAADEEVVRDAAKKIKQKLTELKRSYEAKDKQDYLAMAALIFCIETMQKKDDENVVSTAKKLDELDQLLSVFLEK